MTIEKYTESTIAPTLAYRADKNPAMIYLASLAPRSRITQRNALSAIADILQPDTPYDAFRWDLLRYQHVQAVRAALTEKYSYVSTNRMMAALRRVLKECWRLEYISAETYQRAIDFESLKGQKAAPAEKGRHITQGEFMAMVRACAVTTASGMRNLCMIAVAYTCGLRRDELVSLDLADYDKPQQTITVRKGKGNTERVIPLAPGIDTMIDDWVSLRGSWSGPLFVRVDKAGQIGRLKLSGQAFYRIIRECTEASGIQEFTPHDLRRTFAGDLLDAGVDLSTVQKLMGHKDTKTTAGYDRRGQRAKRDAVNRLSFPSYRSMRKV